MNRKLRFLEALKQVCAARIYRNAPLGDENVNGFARRADGAYAVLDHRDARAGEVGRDDGHLRAGRSVAVTARTPHDGPGGARQHVYVEVCVDLSGAENGAVELIHNAARIKGACIETCADLFMSGILTNGAHGFEVKVLYVKDALEEAFFEHFDQETGDAAHDEAADDVLLSHHFRDEGRCGERSAARTSLKRKAVLKKAGSSDGLGGVLSDDELHRVFRHLGCAGNNAVGIADLLELNDPVDAFLRNGDRRERIRLQIVRDGNDLIGIVRIREGVAQGAAGRLARDAIDVAVSVGRRRCNEGDVDLEVAAFNGAGSAAVRTENSSSGEENG